jgi:hypothetical protein
MNRNVSVVAQKITPPIIWDAYLRLRRLGRRFPWQEFGRMSTCAQAKPLLEGKFANAYATYQPLDPFSSHESWRYNSYNVCAFAQLCARIPGDFLFGGVAWGATARTAFEFVNFDLLDKTLHLVDPFDARTTIANIKKTESYNCDPNYVRKQYPAGSRVIIHQQPIPISVGPLAFVCLETGDYEADIAAIPSFYRDLSSGGAMICYRYADFSEFYEPMLKEIGADAFWLPSGQCVIFKN